MSNSIMKSNLVSFLFLSLIPSFVSSQCFDEEYTFESPAFARGFGEQMDISGDWMIVGMPFMFRNVDETTYFCHGRVDFVKRQQFGVRNIIIVVSATLVS